MSGKKTASLLVIAIALGAAGAGLSMLYLKAREADLIEALKPKSQPIAVVVASKDLVKGDKLSTSTLSVREIPSDYVDPNAIKPGEFESIDGLVLTQNLAAGKPLLKSFIDREFPLDFSDTIAVKRRAMTIQVDETNTISGLLRPGNHIDLFVNMPAADAAEEGTGNQIMPVVENIEVLATGRDAARDYEEKVRLLRGGIQVQPDQNYTTLTLNVTPKEAALITLAQDKGDLMALLRNRKDDSASGFVNVSAETIQNNARELARQAAEKARIKKAGKISTNANGQIVTESGHVLTGVEMTEDGKIRLPDGRVVDPEDVTIGPNGEILVNGEPVEGASAAESVGKLSTNARGEVVTASGKVLKGVEMTEDGKIRLPDGRVVDPDDVTIGPNGEILVNGEPVDGVEAVETVGELKTNAQGQIVTASGQVLTGVELTEDGKVRLPDGRVVDPADITIGPNGEMIVNGEVVQGAQVISAEQAAAFNYEIDYIVGGVSTDSVATVNKLTIEEETESETQE